MRHAVATLIFAAVICVVLAENANPSVDTKPGVKEIENPHVELIPRIKRCGCDRRHRRRSSESSSEEDTVQIKLDIDENDKSSCEKCRKKGSYSDKDETVKIKLDVESKDKSCSGKCHHRSKESCSDEKDTVKIKLDVDASDKSCSDKPIRHNYHHRYSHSNGPQTHYYHHKVPAPVRPKNVKYGSYENVQRYQSPKSTYERPRVYQSQNKYGGYGQQTYESVQGGYRNHGGRYERHYEEPVVCDSDDTITVVV